MQTGKKGLSGGFKTAMFAIAAVAALIPAASPASAADGAKTALEFLIPDDTAVFVTFPNLGSAREQWKNTALYKIWTDKEVEFAVEKLLGNFDSFKKEMEEEFRKATGAELESSLDILKGQLSFAVIRLPGQTEETQTPPSMAFALDFGKQKETLDKLIEFVKQAVGGDKKGVIVGKTTIAGTEVFTYGRENDLTFHYVFLGETLYITMDGPTMEGILNARAGKTDKVLASKDAFVHVRKSTVREGEEALFLYADFKAVSGGIGEAAGINAEELAKSISSLGADTVKSIGLSVTFADGGISDALYIHAPGDKKGMLKIISLAKTATPHLNLVPADAISYMGLKLDFGRIWDVTMDMIKAFDEKALEEINGELAEFAKKTGVNIREDLIGSISDEISSFSSFPKGGGLIPESVMVLSLSNAERFEEAFRKLMEAAGMERKELAYKGRSMRYFTARIAAPGGAPGKPGPGEAPPEGPGEEGPGGLPESPIPGIDMNSLLLLNLTSFQNYFIEGNCLFVSNLTQTLKKVVDRIEGGEKFVSLARNPHYSRLASRLPGSPGLIIYSDLRGIFDLVYNTLLPLGQMGEVFLRKQLNVPFENALLPRSEAMSQHLTPSVSCVSTMPEGVIISSYSTTGVTTIGLAAAGIAGAGAALFLGQQRGGRGMAEAYETAAMGTLKSVCTAQEQFRMAVCVDQDGNGQGEYGFFQELAGTAGLRGNKEGKSLSESPYIPAAMGYLDEKGRIYRNGYYFKIYLPGAESAAVPGISLPDPDAKAAPRQEQAWCIYAWPVQYGVTGRRTFFMNQSGRIYYTYASVKNYGGDNEPAVEAAFDVKGVNPRNMDAVIADATQNLASGDGELWMPGN